MPSVSILLKEDRNRSDEGIEGDKHYNARTLIAL